MKRLSRLRDKRESKGKSKFNMRDLVERYTQGKTVVIIKEEGYYDQKNRGKWVDGTSAEITIHPAAIVRLTSEELRFDEGGTYNVEDRKLYCYKELEKGTTVLYTNNNGVEREYKVHNIDDHSDYDDGLFRYYIKRGDRD